VPAALTEGFAARLSPDGSRLAYLTRGPDPQRATLVVRDLRHGGAVTLSTTCPVAAYSSVPLDWAEQNLAWSPSGTDLYFVDRPGEFVLRRYSVGTAAASGGLVTTGTRESIHDLHLSADARTLAYVVSSQGGSALHLFDVPSGRDRSVTPLGGAANARGWLAGDAGVLIVRRGRVLEDGRVEIAVSQVSGTGVLHEIGRLDHVVSATVRLHQPRSAVYATRSENGVHNVYEYSLRTRTVRRLTDNTLPGVTFSGVEAAGPHLLGVRFERRSDIWVMDGAAPAR
jgi:dipeptidyl aminopeptidase/acylaminoacyl peptidase